MMLPINADARDADTVTVHHYVCLGHPEIVPVLIECGTDIRVRSVHFLYFATPAKK